MNNNTTQNTFWPPPLLLNQIKRAQQPNKTSLKRNTTMDRTTRLDARGRYPLASIHPSRSQFASSPNGSMVQKRSNDTCINPMPTTLSFPPPQKIFIRNKLATTVSVTSLPAPHTPHGSLCTNLALPAIDKPIDDAILQLWPATSTNPSNSPLLHFNRMHHEASSPPLHHMISPHCLRSQQNMASFSDRFQYPVAYFFYGALSCPNTLARVLKLRRQPRLRRARIVGAQETKNGSARYEVEGMLYYLLSDEEYMKVVAYLGTQYWTTVVEIEITGQAMKRSRWITGLTFAHARDTNISLLGVSREDVKSDGGEISEAAEQKRSDSGFTSEPTPQRKSRNRTVRVLPDLQESCSQVQDDLRTFSLRLETFLQHPPSDPFSFQGIDEVLRRLEYEQRECQDRESENNTSTKNTEKPPWGDISTSTLSNQPSERGQGGAKSDVNKPLPPLPKERVRESREFAIGKENPKNVEEEQETMKHRLAALKGLEGVDECDAENRFDECEKMMRAFFDK